MTSLCNQHVRVPSLRLYHHHVAFDTADVITAIKMSTGVGGFNKIFRMGDSAPRFNSSPFYITFLTENVPLSYTFLPGSIP